MTTVDASPVSARPLINLDELDVVRARVHGDRFERRMAPIASRIGAKRLGYNLTRVGPGKRASPFHCHHVNEEMFFILEGSGTLRFGPERYAVRAGDCIACPPGDASVAHQLINEGDADLVYLAVSTQDVTDVWSYPDSGKFGVVAGPIGSTGERDTLPTRYVADGSAIDYWTGE